MPKLLRLLFLLCLLPAAAFGQTRTLWQIGEADNAPTGLALAPDQFNKFVEADFGYEDRFFLVGYSRPATDWPYVLPGPANGWGGSGNTAGIRAHVLNLDFELAQKPAAGPWQLLIDVLETDSVAAPLLKVVVNSQVWKFQLNKGHSGQNPVGNFAQAKEQLLTLDLPDSLLRAGTNEVLLTSLAGGWLVFDQLRLDGPAGARLAAPGPALVKRIRAADYETAPDGRRVQPLLLPLTHLTGKPVVAVKLDGQTILQQTLERGQYLLEAPMPAVSGPRTSRYAVLLDGQLVRTGEVGRAPRPGRTPAGYVNTLLGAGHSRWMIAPGPWMPFGMVKLSPDNQNGGWQAGYDPTFESVGTFSHIHEWTMAGLGTMPVTGPLRLQVGDQSGANGGYRSAIDKATEQAGLGAYQVELTDYGITAELTATTRASFQRYTYHRGDTGRVMVNFQIPSEYAYQLKRVEVKKVSAYRIEGYSHQLTPNVWSKDASQEYTVHFVMEFDQPIQSYGTWLNDDVRPGADLAADDAARAGIYLEFNTARQKAVQVRTGLSYVSIANAALNLQTEISDPCGWQFEQVRDRQLAAWDELLGRVQISTNDAREKERFYTNLYHTLASRNTFSDVDGRWRDADEVVRTLPTSQARALGCDAFWNTFWNLNQVWNLVTPDWSSQWVHSQLAMYAANGWLAKGPAGMEYIPVMVAEHEIPLIVGAYQMGIRDFDAQTAFAAVRKMQTTPATRVGGGLAGNRDLLPYLRHHYVPTGLGRFSNSLEYSFDDWTVGQFAKALGKSADYQEFDARGQWWQNVIDPETKYARLRDSTGRWQADFDPFKSGANEQYVEGNAWQLTFFVPQNVPGLIAKIGEKNFTDRLEWGFEASDKWRFNGPNDQYWDYPVVQGNQQSMHFAALFNWAHKPWLTQKWTRAILDRYYGHGVSNAYLGDEDQGQMSAWFVMSALGLFQTDGGCRAEPIYEISSPLFEKVVIDLGRRYGRGRTFTIEAKNASRDNLYVQSAALNGKPLLTFWFKAADLLKGGSLVLEMGNKPNPTWGKDSDH